MFRAALIVLLMSTPATALDHPSVECTLNADKSSVLVIGANPAGQSYQCMASCRANVTGQRALEPVECKFNLAAGAAEKTVCSSDGGAPKFYSAVSSAKYSCVPR